jgi:predicted DNA-binding transcriptional regulator YafY
MRSARQLDEEFEPRAGFEPRGLRDARTVRVWYSPEIARWQTERGARPLVDGAAIADLSVGSPEWLVGEIFSHRGEAVVLEPEDLRKRVAERAAELAKDLGLTRMRLRA